MGRQITDHIVDPERDKIRIEVVDEPGAGGAHHAYRLTGMDARRNSSAPEHFFERLTPPPALVLFQNGTVPEAGTNGVTQEVLLALVIDRLRCFQAGDFACPENAAALQHCEEALHWLQQRTLKRIRRGVEGQHVA